MTDERMTEIEIKLAHAEQSLAQLSDVIVRQQAQIELLESRYDKLVQELTDTDGGAPQSGNEKPPHY